jgi:hypothetical protein
VKRTSRGDVQEPTAGWLLDLSAKFLGERRFTHAEKLLRRALEWFEGSGEPALVERAVAHHRLAHVALARRHLADADWHGCRALNLRIVADGSEHLMSGAESASVGALLAARGRFEPAELRLRDAMWTIESHLGQDNLPWAIAAHDLASVCEATGRVREAVKLYGSAVYVKYHRLGHAHPSTLLTWKPLSKIESYVSHAWTEASMVDASFATTCAVCALEAG